MDISLTSYKKLYLATNLKYKVDQIVYVSLFSEVATTFNLTFSVITQKDRREDGLVIQLFDSMMDLNVLKHYYGNQILLHHLKNEDYIPSTQSYYLDASFSSMPTKSQLTKTLIKALKTKKTKVKILDAVSLFEKQVENKNYAEIDNTLNTIMTMAGPKAGIGEYLLAKYMQQKNDFEQAFKYYSLAYSFMSKNPLYLFELQNFLYDLNEKETTLILCTKYVQKYTRCSTILKRGMELSILTRKFEHLDLFFASSLGFNVDEKQYRATLNAALSVYIRYLVRQKKFQNISRFVNQLADSTNMQIYWEKMLIELLMNLPVNYWADIYSGTCEELLKKCFPEEAKVIEEMVRYGIKSARASCNYILKNNKNIKNPLAKFLENVLMASSGQE